MRHWSLSSSPGARCWRKAVIRKICDVRFVPILLQKLNGFPGHCQILAYNVGLAPRSSKLFALGISGLTT